MPNRAQLDADLHALEQTLPVQGTVDAAQFDLAAFQARIAELIRVAEPVDHAYLCERAAAMLASAGLGPLAAPPRSGTS